MRLRDLAEHLQVSEMTISRAFNHPQRVERNLRERILAYAQEVGYLPNIASRLLAARRHGDMGDRISTIVLLQVGEETEIEHDRLSIEATNGLAEAVVSVGCALEIVRLPLGLQLTQVLQQLAQRRVVRGMVIDARGQNLDQLELPFGVPVVVVFGHAGTRVFPIVDIDRWAGVDLVTDAFVRAGYRRPGFMAIHEVSSFSRHVYLDACARSWSEAGFESVPPCISFEDNWDCLDAWVQRYQPDVIVGLTPPITVNLLRNLNLRIPQDIAFVSLDVGLGEDFCAGLSCRRADLVKLGLYLLLNDGRAAGAPLVGSMKILIPPLWRDGTSLPLS